MSSGYLYILTNPAIPNLAKVGMTTREPADRIAELSAATGVPSPFTLLFQQPVDEPEAAERWVHRELDVRGYRHSVRREFFAGPLHEIVQIVAAAAAVVFGDPQAGSRGAREIDLPSDDDLAEDIYRMGLAAVAGSDFRAPNLVEAQRYYEQAALTGHVPATLEMAKRKPHDQQLLIYEELANRGHLIGLWHAAAVHLEPPLALYPGARQRAMRMFDTFFDRTMDKFAAAVKDEQLESQFRECAVSYGLKVHGHENVDGLCDETARKALPSMIEAIGAHMVALEAGGPLDQYRLNQLRNVHYRFQRRIADLNKKAMDSLV